MSRIGLFVAGLMVLSSLVFAPAQSEVVILPEEGVLYFTNTFVSDGLTSGPLGPKIFEATDVAPTEATDKKAYTTIAAVALSGDTAFQWTATQPFTIDGTVTASVWISCDVATVSSGAAVNTYRFTLKKNGVTVGTAKSVSDATPQTCTGPSSIREITVAVSAPETSWEEGDTIGASFAIWGLNTPETAAKNVHFVVGSTAHPSHFRAVGIPLTAGANNVTDNATSANVSFRNETLNGTSAKIEASFANATSGVHSYNWTANGTGFNVSVESEVANGSVRVEIVDSVGAVVYSTNRTAANDTQDNESLAPTTVDQTMGPWQIRLQMTDFLGNVTVGLDVLTQSATNSTTSASNETAAPKATAQADGIPSLPLAVLLVAVAAVAVLRRRIL